MKYIGYIAVLFALSSCAHCPMGKDSREVGPKSPIAKSAVDTFSQAPGLTDQQRSMLIKIVQSTYTEATAIKESIAKKKTELFKLAAIQSYESKEIKNIQNEIIALDQQRLALMFRSLKDVQEIVGYGPEKKELYEHLRDYDQVRPMPISSAR